MSSVKSYSTMHCKLNGNGFLIDVKRYNCVIEKIVVDLY